MLFKVKVNILSKIKIIIFHTFVIMVTCNLSISEFRATCSLYHKFRGWLTYWWSYIVSLNPINFVKKITRGISALVLHCDSIMSQIRIEYSLVLPSPANTKLFITIVQCRTNVEDVGPTLYKCYANVLCLLGVLLSIPVRPRPIYWGNWQTVSLYCCAGERRAT